MNLVWGLQHDIIHCSWQFLSVFQNQLCAVQPCLLTHLKSPNVFFSSMQEALLTVAIIGQLHLPRTKEIKNS